MLKETLVELVERLQQGDSSAFEPLFNEFEKTSYYVAYKMLRNEENAKDVVQETAIQVYSKIGALKDPAAFFGWVKMITANLCKRRLEKNQEVLFAPQGADDDESSPEDFMPDQDDSSVPHEVFDNRETRQMIRDLIDDLPDEQKLIIYMYYFQGLKIREIAESLEISENTVKSRMMYAKKKLEAGVRGYEKDGIKLYSVAPWLLFSALAEGSAMLTTPAITVSVSAGAAAAQNAAAAETASAFAGSAEGAAGSAATGTAGTSAAAAGTEAGSADAILSGLASEEAATAAGEAAKGGAQATLTGSGAAAEKAAEGGLMHLIRTTLAGKLIAGAAVVALIGGAAYAVPKMLGGGSASETQQGETVVSEADLEKYESDVVTFLGGEEEYLLEEGESVPFAVTVESEGGLEYTVECNSTNSTVAKLEDGKLIAVKAGVATVTAKTDKGGHKQDYSIRFIAKDNGLNTLGLQMLMLGYSERVQYEPDAKDGRSVDEIPYEEFDWSLFELDFEAFLDGIVHGKTEDKIRRDVTEFHVYWTTMIEPFTGNLRRLEYADTCMFYEEAFDLFMNEGGGRITYHPFGSRDDGIELRYDESYKKYVFDSTEGPVIVDSSLPFAPLCLAGDWFNMGGTVWSYQYDSDGKMTSAVGYDGAVYTFSYDSEGRLTKVESDRTGEPWVEYYYGDDGLLMGFVGSRMTRGTRMLTGVSAYLYS